MAFIFYFLSSVLVLAVLLKMYIKFFLTKYCKSKVCLAGKTAIITGANSGIGYEAALDLACRGARVILACRNEQRGAAAVEKIKNLTENNNVVLKMLDLCSIKSIKNFASDIIENEKNVDILINNAGILGHGAELTEDGFQVEWQCNHFGPVLLTLLLLDVIKQSAPSRIINISSVAAKIFSNLSVQTLNTYQNAFVTYGNTKLANIFFTQELAKKLKDTNVSVFSVHPGPVATEFLSGSIYKTLLKPFIVCFYLTAEEGGQTTIYCACEQGIEHLTGSHFEYCNVVKPYKKAQNPDLAKQIWDETLKVLNK